MKAIVAADGFSIVLDSGKKVYRGGRPCCRRVPGEGAALEWVIRFSGEHGTAIDFRSDEVEGFDDLLAEYLRRCALEELRVVPGPGAAPQGTDRVQAALAERNDLRRAVEELQRDVGEPLGRHAADDLDNGYLDKLVRAEMALEEARTAFPCAWVYVVARSLLRVADSFSLRYVRRGALECCDMAARGNRRAALELLAGMHFGG